MDATISGMVSALGVRLGISETNEIVNAALRAICDEAVVASLNERIRRAGEKSKGGD